MINVTVEELEKIQKTVDDALAMHGKWLENLQRIFACRLSPNESDLAVDAHQRCDFGRWFYSKPNTKLREIAAFQQIEALHTSMHTTVREICAKLRESGQPYSLLLVNLDVKNINYEHSREMGDQVLRSSVTTIKDELGSGGRVYRYGGAEFV